MEVGAVKQAFNNEVIHLKKNLNQAKIQIIHKLTRKAKTLNQKKLPEKLHEKLKRKAESAIKEVLLIKKIKCKDIAKFAVTHKEDLQKYLNKPVVDDDKACARLLLHKSLHEKYKFIRSSFSNIPIKDLLMSRVERRKIKKDLREQQKEKKKSDKHNAQRVSEDESDVEDLLAKIKNKPTPTGQDSDSDAHVSDADDDMVDEQSVARDLVQSQDDDGDENEDYDDDKDDDDDEEDDNEDDDDNDDEDDDNYVVSDNDGDDGIENNDSAVKQPDNNVSNGDSEIFNDNLSISDGDIDKNEIAGKHDSVHNDAGKFVKMIPTVNNLKSTVKPPKEDLRKKLPKKNKDMNKQKLSKKILQKRNKSDKVEEPEGIKVVDPFFKTVSGESYMSLAEPRAPDEIKEVHKQGNRKMRRAVMFGHAPKHRPRHNYKDDSFGNNERNSNNTGNYKDKSKFQEGFRTNKNSKTDFKSNGFTNDKSFNNKRSFEKVAPEKTEKLHPSWEAKKRISSMLPFQGKKTVFEES